MDRGARSEQLPTRTRDASLDFLSSPNLCRSLMFCCATLPTFCPPPNKRDDNLICSVPTAAAASPSVAAGDASLCLTCLTIPPEFTKVVNMCSSTMRSPAHLLMR